MKRSWLIASAALLCMPVSNWAKTYYISPSGNNNSDGQAQATPFKTFAKAFSTMVAGDELVLLDGVYSEAAGTGYISHLGTNSGQIPSGTPAASTSVRALNPGNTKVIGGLVVGRIARKDSYISVRGITFVGQSALYNSSYVTVKDCGFFDVSKTGGMTFGVGTNDHDQGNSYNLIEDCWVWGQNRGIAINYRAHDNVWRRVLVRGDGCDTAACAGSGNPNIGITVYESSNVSLQNVFVVDRILGGGYFGGDFATAQHTPGVPYGNLEWLGDISLNSEDVGFYLEPDEVSLSPAHRLRDCVAWDTAGGLNLARAGTNDVRNCTVRARNGHSGIRIESGLTSGLLQNVVVLGSANYGINSALPAMYANVFGTWTQGAYSTQSPCSVGCSALNSLADGSIKYIARIEPWSPLKGTGAEGADYGANVVYRYGLDGTRSGEPGFNTLTTTPLWPWPNESRLKKEMCADTGVTRGFCAKASLTEYVWTYLGNAVPADFVSSGNGGTLSACDVTRDGLVNAADVSAARDQALGTTACTTADLEPNGQCNVVDVQRVINATLGQSCRTGP